MAPASAPAERALTDTGGVYLEPTVFDHVAPDSRLAREEIFGPVLSVLTFDDLDEAVALANATEYGLASRPVDLRPVDRPFQVSRPQGRHGLGQSATRRA